jgi:hypothetical protein
MVFCLLTLSGQAKTKIKRGKYTHKCPPKRQIVNAKYF